MEEVLSAPENKPELPEEVRSIYEVAFRALCLRAYLTRAQIEDIHPYMDELQRDQLNLVAEKIRDRLFQQKLVPYLSEAEYQLIFKDLKCTCLSRQVYNRAIYPYESYGVLLWSLSQLDSMPNFDTPFPESILELVDFKMTRESFMQVVTLRDFDELNRAKEVAWSYVMRAIFGKPGIKAPDFAYATHRTIYKGEMSGNIELDPKEYYDIQDYSLPAFDLSAYGKPFSELSETEARNVLYIAGERYFALRWIIERNWHWNTRVLYWHTRLVNDRESAHD